MNTNKAFVLGAIALALGIGLGIGLGIYGISGSSSLNDLALNNQGQNNSSKANEPLYWVAPMDANYKRDKPGKSPMGMDLIPVYDNTQDSDSNPENKTGPGTVTISPEVINNMGVRTTEVTLGRLNNEINTVGYVQYDEDRLVHIHPRVEGWIEKLYVKAKGDPVEKGEPLYTLYSPTLVNAQEEYLMALRRNNSVLINAAKERLMALQVPEPEINRIRSAGKISQTITITAPQSGVLDYLDAREGMYVQPGIKMMSIGELQHLWVIGEVFERQISQLNVGDAATVSLDYFPGTQWQGIVDYIYPSLNEKTRSAQVRIHIDNENKQLHPGMFAHLLIEATVSQEALVIPSEALIRMGRQTGDALEKNRVVIALGDGRFKSIEVQVGQRGTIMGQNKVEILSGLNQGDVIVTSAQFLIDSESSKTSDFKRMTPVLGGSGFGESASKSGNESDNDEHDNHEANVTEPSSVSGIAASVDGIIQTVNHQAGTLTITRGPITQWDRPTATLEFNVNEGINIHSFEAGERVRFTFELIADEFTITAIDKKPEVNSDKEQHL